MPRVVHRSVTAPNLARREPDTLGALAAAALTLNAVEVAGVVGPRRLTYGRACQCPWLAIVVIRHCMDCCARPRHTETTRKSTAPRNHNQAHLQPPQQPAAVGRVSLVANGVAACLLNVVKARVIAEAAPSLPCPIGHSSEAAGEEGSAGDALEDLLQDGPFSASVLPPRRGQRQEQEYPTTHHDGPEKTCKQFARSPGLQRRATTAAPRFHPRSRERRQGGLLLTDPRPLIPPLWLAGPGMRIHWNKEGSLCGEMVTTCIVRVSNVQTGSGGMLVSVVPVYTTPCAAPNTAIARATRRIMPDMPSL